LNLHHFQKDSKEKEKDRENGENRRNKAIKKEAF
jgi:hypothetical protein